MNEEKPLWYCEKSRADLTKEDLIKFHAAYLQKELGHLDFFYKYRNYYTVVLLALLASYSGILLQFYESRVLIITTVMPVSMIVLSYFGTKSIDRYYLSFLETVTVIAKIENLLGIDKSVSSKLGKPLVSPFPCDETFMIKRHVTSRFGQEFDTSDKFIEHMMRKGDNKWAHLTFSFFILVGIILAVTTAIMWFMNINVIPAIGLISESTH